MNKLTRRDFVTKLLSVPVAAVGVAVAIDVLPDKAPLSVYEANARKQGWPYQGRKAEYIIVDDVHAADSYLYGTGGDARQRQTDLLAKWYNSKLDTLIHRRLYHG